MMARPRRERMRAMGAAYSAGRPHDHGRALIIRLIAQHALAHPAGARLPRRLEFRAIPFGIVAVEKFMVGVDAAGDEIGAGLLENRAALAAIGHQQLIATPALQSRRQLPAEIADVLEAVVKPVAAIGRVAVRGVAGDEDAPDAIALGDRNAQIPKADMIEFE